MPNVERPDMSGYGVPDELDGVLPWSWAEERLLANKNFWVVTVNADGRPHAMPVWGVWLTDPDAFWFSCDPSARKLRNIAANPQVVVTGSDTVECISVEGVARRVDLDDDADASAVATMIETFVSKYWPDESDHAAMERFLRNNAVVEVTPDRAFGIVEREEEFSQRATRWVW